MNCAIRTAFLLALILCSSVRLEAAGEADATAIVDRAIKAAGGQEKLSRVKVMTWKAKGTLTINDMDNQFTSETTLGGLDHVRAKFQANFNGNEIEAVTVVNGDKGWRDFADMKTELDKDALSNERRMMYLQWIPAVLLPLKDKEFKIETAGEEQVDGKPATALKITAPDKKDFTMYFDKETGLPVKQVAKVIGFSGEEYTQDTLLRGYKDFDGIKKATKIESRREGEKFVDYEISDFKTLDKIDPSTFKEPD